MCIDRQVALKQYLANLKALSGGMGQVAKELRDDKRLCKSVRSVMLQTQKKVHQDLSALITSVNVAMAFDEMLNTENEGIFIIALDESEDQS